MEPTRGERLADATGAPRRPYVVSSNQPPAVAEHHATMIGHGPPSNLPPGVRYEDVDTGRLYVGASERWPVNSSERKPAPEPVPAPEQRDRWTERLIMLLILALILVAAGEVAVLWYLNQLLIAMRGAQ
jgi:hypothetical protein